MFWCWSRAITPEDAHKFCRQLLNYTLGRNWGLDELALVVKVRSGLVS